MKIMGKIFAVLVVLLAVAVAVLSWMLAEQRKVFRAHSEALAEGLMKVAAEIKNMEGVNVDDEMGKVTYTKAPDGGKESGTLGFEDFKKNNSSVSSSVSSLIAGIRKRHEQMTAFAETIMALENTIGVEVIEGADKNDKRHERARDLMKSGEYAEKLKNVEGRARLVIERDEALCDNLGKLADKLGVRKDEVSLDKFRKCEQDNSEFTIGNMFDEFDNAIKLLFIQQNELVKAINDFENGIKKKQAEIVDELVKEIKDEKYGEDIKENGGFQFDNREIGSLLTISFMKVSKANDGAAKRKEHEMDLKAKLAIFSKNDAVALNGFMEKLKKGYVDLNQEAKEQKEIVKNTENQNKELGEKIERLEKDNKKLKEENEWAKKNLEEIKIVNSLIEENNAEPVEKKIVTELKDVDPQLTCEVRYVETKCNFVIISANNRQVCPSTRLIVLSGSGSETKLKANLEVKECTDEVSMAFVTRGDINSLAVGDRVELSVNHEMLVKKQEDAQKQAEAAKKRAAIEAETERARKAIEARKEAERQNALGGEGL